MKPLQVGEARVHVEWLSIDPTQRGWLNAGPNYRAPVDVGEVMRGAGVGTVVESSDEALPVGAQVYGELGWQEYMTASASGLFGVNVVPEGLEPRHMLSILGTNGLTAYFGMTEIGRPSPGDTVLVSAAAGATGSIAAQIARSTGCRTIGIAGGREKCEWMREAAGLDASIDYRSGDVSARLEDLAPDGIDVYFDNVGGEQLEAAIGAMKLHGRIAICGMISGYNATAPQPGPANLALFIGRRITMAGFLVADHDDLAEEFSTKVGGWLADGRIVAEETVVDGLDHAVDAFIGLLRGQNTGKMIISL